jgi:hypothetical protein
MRGFRIGCSSCANCRIRTAKPTATGTVVRDPGVAVTWSGVARSTDFATGHARVDTQHELGCIDAATVDEISLNGAPVVDGPAQDQDLAPLTITAGGTQLWRVLNAATDAFLDLALIDEAGTPVPVRITARDGAPLTDDSGRAIGSQPTSEAQLVPPAGRVEFLVSAPPLGRKVYLVSHAVDTGCTGDAVPERRLGVLTSLPYAADRGDDGCGTAPSAVHCAQLVRRVAGA